MLSQAIGNLLPSAIGVALSPVPVIAVILMLGTPKARSNGTAFALGWVTGLVAVSVIVLIVVGGASNPNSDTATGVNWLDVFLGVLFLAMAARQWRGRPKKGEEATMPTWMASIDGFGSGKSGGLGVLLSGVNPKNLALTLAAAAGIAEAGLSGGQNAVAVAVFVVIGSLSVAGPVLFFLLAPARATQPLATIKEFMSDHNAVIMMVILLVLGLKLLGAGIGGLGR
jgi:threonine/homoserine/homoserine lactone efflux protein